MTDYYEELSLSRKLDTKQIQEELVRLESLWRKREVNSPEKANKMLGIIMDAQKVFASEASRGKYDNDLEISRREPEDPDASRSKSLEKWAGQARMFYDDGQYDLAKVAIEKAISLSNINGDDDALFALASDIYKDNGDLDLAMTYINRAIVAAPDVLTYYLSKGLIYDQQASAAMQYGGYGKPTNFRSEARKMFQLADTKAERIGDLTNRARACGALAFSFYFQEPMDKETGEDFANLSVKFGGDSWGNADKVLNEVNAIREEARRKELEKENARKEGIYSEAKRIAETRHTSIYTKRIAETREISELERAISKFETISDYKDSAQQIENLVTRIQKIVDDSEKEKQAKIKLREMDIKEILKVLPIFIVLIVFGIIICLCR